MRCLGQASAVGGCGLVEGRLARRLRPWSRPSDGVLTVLGRGSSIRDSHPARKSFPRSAPRFCTRCQTCPAPGPTCGPWDDPSREWSRDAGEFTWALSASVLVVLHASHRLWVPARLRSGRGSDGACRHGLIGDHTVFHVVPHWRARPEIVAPSKRSCQIAQRIVRTPRRARGVHTFSRCSRNVTVWQVRSRHIQRRLCHRIRLETPAQGGVEHLHHHAPVTVSKSPRNPGSQHSDHRTLCQAPDHTHAERQKPDGNPPSQRADHTDHNDQATQSSSRQGETPPEVLDDSGGRSPHIIKDRDLYPQPPTNTHSPTPNPEKPPILTEPYGEPTFGVLLRGRSPYRCS